eukprot:TRINITY_DN12714_c2_g1_i1.p1 TRINITY_DN12714_c2_g1~~TRINITY_DN12714_c2_g1_i1.p1  ORF type:complete len:340 (-),score=46.70 TRINITY_DN12714_c2_g1_i1:309-1328(-)
MMKMKASAATGLLLAAVCMRAAGIASADQNEVGSYDENIARKFAYYAQAVFCTDSAIRSWTCGPACDNAPIKSDSIPLVIGPGRKYSVQGLIAEIPAPSKSAAEGVQHCVVAFRGSVNLPNWEADLIATRVSWAGTIESDAKWCDGCLVHKGFAEAYAELREDMFKSLKYFACDSITVVGHSLGAAVATLATLDIRSSKEMLPKGPHLQVQPSFLFGSPRVGNKVFVEAFASAAKVHQVVGAWRVVHYHDPVPRLPPQITSPLSGECVYSHIAQEVYYTTRASSEYKICDESGEDPSCADSVSILRCVNMDHVTYLNITFASSKLPTECLPSLTTLLHV